MDDSNEFYPYRDDRVLIGIPDVLETDRPGLVVQLSGSQAEMMRNLVAYGRRGFTWVSEYQEDGYLGPDDDQWDAIYPMVSDLEYRLMGNEGTLFNVKDTFGEEVYEQCATTIKNIYIGPAADDEIIRLTSLWWRTVGTASSIAIASLYKPAVLTSAFAIRTSLVDGQFYNEPCLDITLTSGFYVQITFRDVTAGQYVDVRVTGYTMAKAS